jgi:hypothetical protein
LVAKFPNSGRVTPGSRTTAVSASSPNKIAGKWRVCAEWDIVWERKIFSIPRFSTHYWKNMRLSEAFRPNIPMLVPISQVNCVRSVFRGGKVGSMTRTILACSLVALIAATAGCRMCAGPYDDCGPTFTGGHHCSRCETTARAGSILSGDLGPVDGVIVDTEISEGMVDELAPTPEGFESLPVETDPSLETPMPESSAPPAPEPETDFDESVRASSAEQPVIEISPPTPAARWTARRPHRLRWR